MDTQNRRIKLRGSLLDFVLGLAGSISTYSPRYTVIEASGYTLVHQPRRSRGKWIARLEPDGDVEIMADGVIRVTNDVIRVINEHGEKVVDSICIFGWRCFTAEELRLLTFIHIANWYWHIHDLNALRRLACLRFQNFDRAQPVGIYVYGDLNAFLNELIRAFSMFRLNYKVKTENDGYVILGGKWQMRLNNDGSVEIEINNEYKLKIEQSIQINNELVEEMCLERSLCFGAHEIRLMAYIYVIMWYCNSGNCDVMRRFVVRPCQ